MLCIHRLVNSPVPSNCFVIEDKDQGDGCIIVDPGSKSPTTLYSLLNEWSLTPKYIILTHEHFDHCWGVNRLVERYDIPIICSALCADFIQNEKRNCSVFYDNQERFVIQYPTISVESIDYQLPFANTILSFFPTPGHSAASICFLVDKYLFSGDTLIKDLKTVTKLPTGSVAKLKESLDTLIQLKGQGLTVLPGHGDIFLLDTYDLRTAISRGLQ